LPAVELESREPTVPALQDKYVGKKESPLRDAGAGLGGG